MRDRPRVEQTTGAVTFLDVLGWKGIWQRKTNPIDDLQRLVEQIKERAKTASRGRGSYISKISSSSTLALDTQVLVISDTIVLLTTADDSTVQDALEIHGQLCATALPSSVEWGIPLRGATAYGEYGYSREESIFVGKAIDEAAAWYETAEWIGVFMTPSAAFSFDVSRSAWWREYSPPIKDKADKAKIDWPSYCALWPEEAGVGEADVDALMRSMRQLSPIIPSLVNKFTNTLTFVKAMQEKGAKRQEQERKRLAGKGTAAATQQGASLGTSEQGSPAS